jgi:hypothetical protein
MEENKVQEPILETTSIPAVQSVPIKPKTFLVLVVVLLAIVILGTAGFFVYRYVLIRNQAAIATFDDCVRFNGGMIQAIYPATCTTRDGRRFTQSLTEEEQKNLLPLNGTANWKTYENTKYGYQVQYPSTWLVEVMNSEDQLAQTAAANFRMITDETPAESGFSLSVTSDPKDLSLTDWIKQNLNNGTFLVGANDITGSTVSVSGLTWERINNDSIGYVPTGLVKYGLAHNGNLYYVVVYSADAKTLDQIMSTFKFTSDTTNWKTYDAIGFSFKYPKLWNEGPSSDNIRTFLSTDQLYLLSVGTPENRVGATDNRSFDTIEEYLSAHWGSSHETKQVQLDGKNVIQIFPFEGSENVNEVAFLSKDKKNIIMIQVSTDKSSSGNISEAQNLFREILSTFKFTN